MIVKFKDLCKAQVNRMKRVYGMTNLDVLVAAQRIVDPSELEKKPVTPSRRSKYLYGKGTSVARQSRYTTSRK